MRGEKTGFERLLSAMPKGWEGKAKELGAFVRGWEIRNAVDLLRLVFIGYKPGGVADHVDNTKLDMGLGENHPYHFRKTKPVGTGDKNMSL
jgi:hypothetical protein